MRLTKTLGASYSPLYFLAALGYGGLVVTFFMIIMFIVPHPGTPIPTFDGLWAVVEAGDPLMIGLIAVSVAGIAWFAAAHIRMLIWNIRQFQSFKRTESYATLRTGNDEVQLMAMPLTIAMSVNVGFILGAVFVPGLWTIVEYLFPFAFLAFLAIGAWALYIYADFKARVFVNGHFDCARNNSLAQMLAVFALAMVSVGLSAPAAMSHEPLTSGIALTVAIMFTGLTVVLLLIKLPIGFRAMMEHGVQQAGAATLWIMVPILTVLGIAVFRQMMAFDHVFGLEVGKGVVMFWFAFLFGIQMLFGLLGWLVLKRTDYFAQVVRGERPVAGAFALVCPGVATVVLGQFLLHKGLVDLGIVDKLSPAYWLLMLPLVALQISTIRLVWRLMAKLTTAAGDGVSPAKAVPAAAS